MYNITVHRGTHEIGGSIVEIADAQGSILIDFGRDLAVDRKSSTDQTMVEMIRRLPNCKAVLFTHYHGDHIGLLAEIPAHIPIYLGAPSRKILLNIRAVLMEMQGKDGKVDETLRREYEILQDNTRVHAFHAGGPLHIPGTGIDITPLAADHSAFDAYMFLIRAGGKTILHTGDFRAHGWTGEHRMDEICALLERTQIDVLLIEGTMMGDPDKQPLPEWKLYDLARRLLARPENKYACLLCSSTNADSLASFCLAAHKNGRPFLVSGSYALEQIKVYRERKDDHAVYAFPGCRPIPKSLEQYRESGFLMLIGENDYYEELMEPFQDSSPLLIYSLWHFYRVTGPHLKPRYKELWEHFPNHTELHSGGHAGPDALARLIRAADPTEAILPIHTEKRENFDLLDIGPRKEKLRRWDDGDSWPPANGKE